MLAVSHSVPQGKPQMKAIYFYKDNADKMPSLTGLIHNIPFLTLLARAYGEYNMASAQQDRPFTDFDMDYISFAVLRFFHEFKEVLGFENSAEFSPRILKDILTQFHHTPHDPCVDKG